MGVKASNDVTASTSEGGGGILANCRDFIKAVLIFDLQNLLKLGRPDFPEFQSVTVLVFKIIFSNSPCLFSANRELTLLMRTKCEIRSTSTHTAVACDQSAGIYVLILSMLVNLGHFQRVQP